jgi:hypothetical protein
MPRARLAMVAEALSAAHFVADRLRGGFDHFRRDLHDGRHAACLPTAPPVRPGAQPISVRNDRIAVAAFRAMQLRRLVEEHLDDALVLALRPAAVQLRRTTGGMGTAGSFARALAMRKAPRNGSDGFGVFCWLFVLSGSGPLKCKKPLITGVFNGRSERI